VTLFCFKPLCLVMPTVLPTILPTVMPTAMPTVLSWQLSTNPVAVFCVKMLPHLGCLDRGIFVANAQIWAADRLKGFYKGCGTNLLRTTPAAALTFTSFELIQRQIKIYAQDKRDRQAADATAS